MENNRIEIISKPVLELKDVMTITGRGKDYCRSIMDKIISKHRKFYDEYFYVYRCKCIKTIHLYEAIGYTNEEFYNLFKNIINKTKDV